MSNWLRDVPTEAERSAGWRGKFVFRDEHREYEITVGELQGVPILAVIGNDCTPAKFYGHASDGGATGRDYWHGALHVLDDLISTTRGLPHLIIERVWGLRTRINSGDIPRQDPPFRDTDGKE